MSSFSSAQRRKRLKTAGFEQERKVIPVKTAKRIFLILTIVCAALAAVLDITALCMQVQVSGERLLTMDSRMGYLLAVSYRWVTLAAVIFTVAAAALVVAYILSRKKRKRESV